MTGFQLTILFSTISFATHSWANDNIIHDCDIHGANCSEIVACIEETGEYFRGGASNDDDGGPLIIRSSLGHVCTGDWWRTVLGIGRAEITCDDGRAGKATFLWFDKDSGTVVGSGTLNNGEEIRYWTGGKLEQYFNEIDPAERDRMSCSPGNMLIG